MGGIRLCLLDKTYSPATHAMSVQGEKRRQTKMEANMKDP